MKKKSKAAQCIEAYRSVGEATDPLGSYTGLVRDFPTADYPLGQYAPGLEYMPSAGSIAEQHTILGEQGHIDPELLPVQDADDL